MAEKPSTLAKVIVGGLIIGSGALVLYNLLKPKPTVQVTVASNPIRTAILIDDKTLVKTPKALKIETGVHTFKAVKLSPDMLTIYRFDKWTVNGRAVAYDTPALTLDVTRPLIIRADYMLAGHGIYPIMPLIQ